MKQVVALAFIGFCLFAGSAGQKDIAIGGGDFAENARIFFGTGDPCTNSFYQFFGITDVKCSMQCYIQAGYQQGGYCENGVCQCNDVSNNSTIPGTGILGK